MSASLETLLRRAQDGDKDAREQLVVENTGLVWSIARRFFGRGVDPDDLYQLGCLGFLKAIDGFDLQYCPSRKPEAGHRRPRRIPFSSRHAASADGDLKIARRGLVLCYSSDLFVHAASPNAAQGGFNHVQSLRDLR